jgi:plasmid rolling circle replication initiator protein Rep
MTSSIDVNERFVARERGLTANFISRLLKLRNQLCRSPAEESVKNKRRNCNYKSKNGSDYRLRNTLRKNNRLCPGRNIRRDSMDELKKAKKDSTMTEDEVTAAEKVVQDVTDKFIKQVDVLTAAKEKELMAI